MAAFSWLLLFWTVAMVTAGPPSEPEVTLESLQEQAETLASSVVNVIDEVNAAIPAYLDAAAALNDAADQVENLEAIRNEIGDLKTSARDLPDTNRTELRATVDRIQELYGAVQQTHNKVNMIEYRTAERVTDPISEAVQILEDQKEVIGVQFVPEYYVEVTRYTWSDAQANCVSRGMDLVSITTEETQQILDSLADENGLTSSYWTSGQLIDGQLVWTALDNTPVEDGYTNWIPSYPAPAVNSQAVIVGQCSGLGTGWCAPENILNGAFSLYSMCQTYPEN